MANGHGLQLGPGAFRSHNSTRIDSCAASQPQPARKGTLLAFVWANHGDADSTVRALEEGTLVLTGNFKGLESEVAIQAKNHSHGGTT
jgi:hypothetical protein